jgi:hypothetical protein
MLHVLMEHHRVTPPAIWGKLPGHADFVRSGVRHGESEAWQPGLAAHAPMDATGATAALPAAFVLPPNALGVRHLPWADWPGRLHAAGAESAFWQQDAAGGFVNAGTRLAQLWGTRP